jgi:hypothetical protein
MLNSIRVHNIVTCLRRVLDRSDLLDSLIQRVTKLSGWLLQTLVSTVTSLLPLLDSGFPRRTFPFLWLPNLSPGSATSFSQQQLSRTEPQQQSSHSLTDYLIHQPTNSTQLILTNNCHVYNMSARIAQKAQLLCCCLHDVSVETHLFAKPSLSNGCCIFAYLAVVAQQRVYMPQ